MLNQGFFAVVRQPPRISRCVLSLALYDVSKSSQGDADERDLDEEGEKGPEENCIHRILIAEGLAEPEHSISD